jgi:hypothetical protein
MAKLRAIYIFSGNLRGNLLSSFPDSLLPFFHEIETQGDQENGPWHNETLKIDLHIPFRKVEKNKK